jgi:malate dehydrogenase (oxaloacetate-decarboxylating)
MDIYETALELHKKYKGKIKTSLRDTSGIDLAKLSAYYSPGVAAVSTAIAADPSLLPLYTWTNNLVAVISNGTAVLGLGDIGPKAAMPVMEGKALLFKHFADIDSIPIVINAQTADEIVDVVSRIAPSFGAINLEDIAAPICFEVEERLKATLDIPVFHDDQHGTAIVVLAGLINAMKVVNKKLKDCKIILVGAGAAGTATAKLLYLYAQPEIIVIDSKGTIDSVRTDLNDAKKQFLDFTNPHNLSGDLDDALIGADIFIGVSKANLLSEQRVTTMAEQPIIFALANPDPELSYDLAKKMNVAVYATGRSDYPNQVNNAVAFPGIFRGALDHGVQKITDDHKIAAAQAIAGLIDKPTAELVIPSVMDDRLVPTVAAVIR